MIRRQISTERKGLYYLGKIIGAIGFLIFASVFVSFVIHFGDFRNFEENARSMGMRAIVGMGMMIFGGFLTSLGRSGAAGSGLILDPEKARQDEEPWSRMSGGIMKDALDEAGIRLGSTQENGGLPFDEQLRRLHKLREDGILSEAEYLAKKQQILERQ